MDDGSFEAWLGSIRLPSARQRQVGFILNPAVGIACSPESLAFYWHVRRDQCLPGSPGG
jgi:hypothetical protein